VRHLLNHAIFENSEVSGAEIGHGIAISIQDAHVDRDQHDSAAKWRELLLRGERD
jgi:hypothetical protein